MVVDQPERHHHPTGANGTDEHDRYYSRGQPPQRRPLPFGSVQPPQRIPIHH
jgi:hypothetical protein